VVSANVLILLLTQDHRQICRRFAAHVSGLADLEADRQVANTLAELIIGGSLISIEVADEAGGTSEGLLERAPMHKSVHKPHARGPFSVRERPSGLGGGGGI